MAGAQMRSQAPPPGDTVHAEPRVTDAMYLSMNTTGRSNASVQILSVQTVQPGNGS